jgi:N-acetyl-gamma-glutamyl-phosphate reductase
MKSVYIAGRSGASGLLLQSMLQHREDLRLLPGGEGRGSADAESEQLNSADVVVLCLPPAGVRATLARLVNPCVKVVDNSAEHRVADGWAYGLPELGAGQREAIRTASRVSSPGCFATGFILAVRPLVQRGLVDARASLCVQGIGGYSVGGKRMVERFEQAPADRPAPLVQVHALNLEHPQVPEMQHHAGLARPPLFVPLVGNFHRGMLVLVGLHRDWLATGASPATLREALREHYAAERLVAVRTCGPLAPSIPLPPAPGSGVDLFVEGNDQVLLVARLDNLGKGGAVAAVQNVNLLLGCDEFAGTDLPAEQP